LPEEYQGDHPGLEGLDVTLILERDGYRGNRYPGDGVQYLKTDTKFVIVDGGMFVSSGRRCAAVPAINRRRAANNCRQPARAAGHTARMQMRGPSAAICSPS
jgi:hypothetical protein